MLIGLSGKIGSGKNTVADIICKLDSSFTQVAFATKLRQIVNVITGIPVEKTKSQEDKNVFLPEWNMTIGNMLQILGTECMRNNLHHNTWVLALFSEYDKTKNWIITDVRFPNEAQAILNHGGKLIKIYGDPANIRKNSNRNLNHASETSLDTFDRWDYIVKNENAILNLRIQTESILNDIRTTT